jgi:hypothetical protein
MSTGVGSQATKETIDASLTDIAVTIRNLMSKVKRLDTQVNGQGNGIAYLTRIGYDNTAANPANPGAQTDAAWALQTIAYLNTQAGVYFGTVRQGGDGTVNSATVFAFDNALSLLWAGQLG